MVADLIAELDSLFGKAAQAKPKAKGKKPTFLEKGIHKASSAGIEYWTPEAVVLLQSSWTCTCGCSGECAPMLTVREKKGRATRLRGISRSSQYSTLPREIERADPAVVADCQHCFESTPLGHPQLTLPLGELANEPLAEFVQQIEYGLTAAEIVEAFGNPRMSTREYHSLHPDARELRLSIITQAEKEH